MNTQAKEPRILVVNDSLNLLNLFHDILDGQGYDIELSNYTFEGVESIERLRPDLIILDFVHEGGTTEWQLLQMLKMHESTASIPIVLCVTALRIFQEDHFRKKNIVLLYKPFEKDDLLEAVHQAFQLPR